MRSLVPKLPAAAILMAALIRVPAAGAAPTLSGAFKLTTGRIDPDNKIVVGPRYRFAVRAVAAWVVDGSPAERAFEVARAPRHR